MPSLSLSGSGQPSSSSNPSLSSGSFGHLSSLSRMPSLSLSGSGQPSASSNPSLSSGSVGHLSVLSGMPSPSLSSRLGGLCRGCDLSRCASDGAGAALARQLDRLVAEVARLLAELDRLVIARVAADLARLVQVLDGGGVFVRRQFRRARRARLLDRFRRLKRHHRDVLDGP